MTMRCLLSLAALTLWIIAPAARAQRAGPAAVSRAPAIGMANVAIGVAPRASYADARRAMPTWVKWGLVGAAAGAVTFPLLGSMASDSRGNAAGDAVAGAAIGFVIVGGGVALWQAMCAPDSSSRRAGLCGR